MTARVVRPPAASGPPPPYTPTSLSLGDESYALRRSPTVVTFGAVLTTGPGDTIVIKKIEPPTQPLSAMECFAYYLLAFFVPPLAVGLLKGGNHDMGINLFLTFFGWLPGMFHASTIVHDQNRHRLVYKRVPATELGLLAALQGYEGAVERATHAHAHARGGGVGSMWEREYLPVMDKDGRTW